MTPNEIITEALYNIYGASTPDASVQTRATSVLKRLYDQVQRKVPWWFLERKLEFEVAGKVDLSHEVFESKNVVFQKNRVVIGDKSISCLLSKTAGDNAGWWTAFNDTTFMVDGHNLFVGGVGGVFKINTITGASSRHSSPTYPNGMAISIASDGDFLYVLMAERKTTGAYGGYYNTIEKVRKRDMSIVTRMDFGQQAPTCFSTIKLVNGTLKISGEVTAYSSAIDVDTELLTQTAAGATKYLFVQGMEVKVTQERYPQIISSAFLFSLATYLYGAVTDGTWLVFSYAFSDGEVTQCVYDITGALVWENRVDELYSIQFAKDGIGYAPNATIRLATGEIIDSGFMDTGGSTSSPVKMEIVYTSDVDNVSVTYGGMSSGDAEKVYYGKTLTFYQGKLVETDNYAGGVGRTSLSVPQKVSSISGIWIANDKIERVDREDFDVMQAGDVIYAEEKTIDGHCLFFKPIPSVPTSAVLYYSVLEDYDAEMETNTSFYLEDYLIKKLTAELSLITEYADRYKSYSIAAEDSLYDARAMNCNYTAQEFKLGYADV